MIEVHHANTLPLVKEISVKTNEYHDKKSIASLNELIASSSKL